MNGDREALASALRGHSLVSSDRVKGTIDCRCGWSGPYLSRHQADALLPVVDAIARRRAAEELRGFADELEACTLAHRATVVRHHQSARRSNQLRDRELRAGHQIAAMLSIVKQARRQAEGAGGLAAPRPPIDRRHSSQGLEHAKSSADALEAE